MTNNEGRTIKMFMSQDQKDFAKELYKAHFTAKEAATFFPFGYATIRGLWRGFDSVEIQKYDRLDLIEGGNLANAHSK